MKTRSRNNPRREFLKSLGCAAGLATVPAALAASLNPRPRFSADPFSLGVASGYPESDGVVLWTRLAPIPSAPGGGMDPESVAVRWEIAEDERFARIAASGTARADPDWAHSVHVEAGGLQANRHYWYRFMAGDATSPVGRTRTAPPPDVRTARLRFAFASCQHYEHGFFGAYRHMVRDDPDLILFLGDYIYESSYASQARRHQTREPVTLDEYRARYALYKSDPDLKAAHAAAPWVVTWDDHEVQNDYAGDRSRRNDDPQHFLLRRAAAYKAYYEHLPLRRSMLPSGPSAYLYRRLDYGDLASFHVLDDRQYRAPQACRPQNGKASTKVNTARCAQLDAPERTLLGAAQETWLDAGLGATRSRWNVIAQQTAIAQLDYLAGPGRRVWTDGWDGYPEARRSLLQSIATRKPSNPVVIGGDLHAFFVADLKSDFDRPDSPTIATEFVGTSLTSRQEISTSNIKVLLGENPHLRFGDAEHRGYVRVELTPERMRVDLRAMESVAQADSACRTLASFVVEQGIPGAQPV